MTKYGLSFHHLGLATKQKEKAIVFLKGIGYSINDIVLDELQNVNLIMCKNETMPDVEIVYPTNTKGPLTNIFSSMNELVYHICYETANLKEWLNAIKKENRIFYLSTPKPAILFDNREVSFYQIGGFGLIEILE